MVLTTIVIDDEPIALEKLKNYTQKVPFLKLVGSFDNSLDALEFLASEKVDLIVTDIEMPDLNGMDMINGLTDAPSVIFTTAYEQYAVDSYRVRAVDYLLKPYSFADFQRAANRALQAAGPRPETNTSARDTESIFVKTDTRYVKIDTADILYIKGFGEYLQIYLRNARSPLLTLSSFAAIKERLGSGFLQVHRSYVVNMANTRMIERSRINLCDDTAIPVSDGYRASLQTWLAGHSVGRSSR